MTSGLRRSLGSDGIDPSNNPPSTIRIGYGIFSRLANNARAATAASSPKMSSTISIIRAALYRREALAGDENRGQRKGAGNFQGEKQSAQPVQKGAKKEHCVARRINSGRSSESKVERLSAGLCIPIHPLGTFGAGRWAGNQHMKRIGILTAGGASPALNATIQC